MRPMQKSRRGLTLSTAAFIHKADKRYAKFFIGYFWSCFFVMRYDNCAKLTKSLAASLPTIFCIYFKRLYR